MSPRQSLHDLPFAALEREMAAIPPAHTRTLWRALHRELTLRPAEYPPALPPLRRWLGDGLGPAGRFQLDQPEIAAETASSDGLTRKFLLRLADGQTVETVLMAYAGRFTACVSTQAGCAMGCVFCATGQMGFARHLRAGEIVAQVLQAERSLRAGQGGRVRNLVLMGMGEPLHNYDAVMTALEIISDTRGLNIGPKRITLSTVGVVPGIRRLTAEQRPYHLAVSLHAVSDAERSALVPANRRWPLRELLAACRAYTETLGRRIFFEWTLIAGKNDTPAQAEAVAAALCGIDAHVNLIPLNATAGYAGTASAGAAAARFQEILQAAGLPSTIRQRRGLDVAAGCGQLRAPKA